MLRPRQLGQPVVSRHRIDGDGRLGRTERRFLDLATGRQARQRLAAGEQRRQPHCGG